jgi:hypothetical protein
MLCCTPNTSLPLETRHGVHGITSPSMSSPAHGHMVWDSIRPLQHTQRTRTCVVVDVLCTSTCRSSSVCRDEVVQSSY